MSFILPSFFLFLSFFHEFHSAFFLSLSFYSSDYCRYFLTRVPILEERIQYKFENRFLLQQAVTSADPIRYSDLGLEYVLSNVVDPDPGSAAFLTPGSGISFFRILDHGSRISNIFES
jgi:hypothetical protein